MVQALPLSVVAEYRVVVAEEQGDGEASDVGADEQASGGSLPSRILNDAIDKGIGVSSSSVQDLLTGIKRRFPNATEEQLQKQLGRLYISLATASGAAVGGAAAAPGVGIPAGLAASLAETGGFFTLTATYVFGVAALNGIEVRDMDRRRALLLTALVGPSGTGVIENAIGKTARHWGDVLTQAVPLATIKRINKVLGPWFVTRYGTRMGTVVLGEVIPFGVGAVIGGGFNAVIAWGVVRTMRTAFAPPGTEAVAVGGE